MLVIAENRGRGKTTELAMIAAEDGLYMVCPDMAAARQAARAARDRGLRMNYPITWDDFVTRRYYAPGVQGFVIDDLDRCVQSMTARPVRAIALWNGLP
jgi:hypothetical protein